jgi:hypothetical protein
VLVNLFASLHIAKAAPQEDKVLLNAYIADAKISQLTADLYRSYKIYLHLYDKHRNYFFDNAVTSYISTVRELGSIERLKQVCQVLSKNPKYSDKIKYRCGLELFHVGQYQDVEAYTKSISKSANEYLLGQILLASVYLGQEDHVKCLGIVNDKSLSAFEANKLDDIFFVTKARCQAKGKMFNEAIVSYQSVSAKSRYYFDALSELSWVFFKVRDVELVRNTVKVIQASFKKDIVENSFQHATIGQYFFSKYLLAYLDLVVYGTTQKEKFSPLDSELAEYLSKDFVTRDEIRAVLKDIEAAGSFSELKLRSKPYAKMKYHFSQWLPNESIKQLDDNIRILMSVNKENLRFANKVYGKHEIAMRAMRVLKTKMNNDIRTNIAGMYDTSLRTVNGLRLKIKIGEVDLKNLSKTEGLKNLDEATTIYKEKENSLAQKMGSDI